MSESERYIDTFRQEAEELLADVEDAILLLEQDTSDSEQIGRLFRAMHTIKGSGAMFGFDEVAAFTHHVETALDRVRSGMASITPGLIALVLASRDLIGQMMAGNAGDLQEEASRIIRDLGALMDQPGESAPPMEAAAQETSDSDSDQPKEYRITFVPDPSLFASGMDPALLLDELRGLGDCRITADTGNVPPLERIDPESCYLSWHIQLTTFAGLDAIRDVFIFVEDTSQIDIREVSPDASANDPASRRLGEILVEEGDVTTEDVHAALSQQRRIGEILVESGAVPQERVDAALVKQQSSPAPKDQHGQAPEKREMLRVQAEKLDKLVNMVGELVINQARLTQVASSIEHSELALTVEEIERLTGELRDIVLNIRMTPIGTTFGRFKRLVRDQSMELGKEIDLVTEGAETELDKSVIDRLSDPLVHMIRNSIDHGIEAPEQREQSGKPRRGIIRLAAAHLGTNVVITVEDNGKGLDKEGIRRKAIQTGLILPEQELSERELFSLIMAPGFSTAAKVSNISGRGVGMDVVKREIEALRGNVSISSKAGEGTVFTLSLPLTLAIIDGLLVQVGEGRYVIPLSEIEECLEMSSARYAVGSDRNVIQVRGEAVPFIRLRDAFEIHGERSQFEEMVVVRHGESHLGVVVDHVIGDHQTVIKSLGRAYRDVEGISGATILGDGSVALVLDIQSLVGSISE